MAITKQQTPYEFLVRWNNGAVAGAHIRFLERLVEDGVVISEKEGDAKPVSMAGGVGFPIADILTALQVTALSNLASEKTAKAAADTLLQEAQTAHATALATKATELSAAAAAHTSTLAAAQAQVTALQAQIEASAPPAPPAVDPLGPTVSDLQIRLAMNQVGLRTAVEAAVAASTDQSLKDWYERAKAFKRRDPLVLGMIQTLGVSAADADGLFALAASLQG